MLGKLDSYLQKNDTKPPTYTIHQNKLKMDKRLKCKLWHNKSPRGKNIGRKISDIPRSSIFADVSPRARKIKEKINKWDYIKLKSFCTAKETISKMKREPTIWEYIFANDTSDKGLISKIDEEITWLHTRQIIQLKMGKGPEQILLQGGHTEGPETHEKVLNITSHQSDTN